MSEALLIEIGVEELPAIPFLKELPNIEKKWRKILNNYRLESDFDFYYTPRRLVFFHKSFLTKQPDTKEEFFGAPLKIAFKDDKPTPAALGFAKKCGVDIKDLTTAVKNSQEVLYYEKKISGIESEKLLGEMIGQFLESLDFGKSMRWGDSKNSFIRPVRWIVSMLGDKNFECEVFGIKSQNKSFVHRSLGYEPITFERVNDYFTSMKKGGVILDPKERKKRVLKQFEALEREENIKIDIDEELLSEIVAITEFPTALIGRFDEHFLKLPREVIITSMKEHQRYFPVFKDEALSNRFIVVSNAYCDDFSKIIEGNQKVLRPRLSDALFFYENDLKNGLKCEGLKNITFLKGLGTIYDKSQREAKIADTLHHKYKLSEDRELLNKTVMLAKADLLTDMVYEFTELQGIMGYYYAKAAGEDENLYIAIKEQYLPDAKESDLPSNNFSAVVALSNKLDTILSLFAAGKIPTGTKDPFGLRRAALGIVRIVLDRGFEFDIKKDIALIAKDYNSVDVAQVENFFIERIINFFDVNPTVINAVLQSGEREINRISQKIFALDKVVKSDNFKEVSSTFKRVANIVKDIDFSEELDIDEDLLQEPHERELYKVFMSVISKDYDTYEEQLSALFALKPQIDDFFDNVMVNAEDKKLKNNRKNLIANIYKAFRSIAEIKEVTKH